MRRQVQNRGSSAGTRRRGALVSAALGASAIAVTTVLAAPASSAPAAKVDPGARLSSVVYGSGCTYPMTVFVNSSGRVTFWQKRRGHREEFIGAAYPQGASAATTWTPRTTGNRWIYARQNGKTSPLALVRVHQGYGSGGLCFAL